MGWCGRDGVGGMVWVGLVLRSGQGITPLLLTSIPRHTPLTPANRPKKMPTKATTQRKTPLVKASPKRKPRPVPVREMDKSVGAKLLTLPVRIGIILALAIIGFVVAWRLPHPPKPPEVRSDATAPPVIAVPAIQRPTAELVAPTEAAPKVQETGKPAVRK